MKPDFVIFFDGVCNLCNGFIDFVISRDKSKKIFYSSLQDDTSKDFLGDHSIKLEEGFSTIYLYKNGKVYEKSTAILYILKELSPGYRFLSSICLIIPKIIRDMVYGFIAKNRYRFFGKKDTCRMPTPEERQQFI